MKYSGADWLVKSYPNVKPSQLGLKVADILGFVYAGLYHMDMRELKKIKWNNPYVIEVRIDCPLSTTDWEDLTFLVILCHDQAIRMSIMPNMRTMKLLFHQRMREGIYSERHPTMEEAIQRCREKWERERWEEGTR